MKLFAFGYDPSSPSSTTPDVSSPPSPLLRAACIKILWASWCDSIIAHTSSSDTSQRTVEYRGRGLTSAQAMHIANSPVIKEAVSQKEIGIEFFGSSMHEGVRGYTTPTSVIVFSSELEIESGDDEIQTYPMAIALIRMDSSGGYLVSSGDGIVYFDGFASFRGYLEAKSTTSSGKLAPFEPREWFEYLSETCIIKVASGGYMTAAVSAEGELFLWGQANPGDEMMVSVLGEKGALGSSTSTAISADEDQDEMVKCLNVRVEGQEAFVYDVAIGHGHVLVAAEVQRDGCVTARAVLGAGCNENGQLGLPISKQFVGDFEAIPAFAGLKIEKLVAKGWSTLVVTSEG
ncbi:hypothetical protein SNOG_15628 [Parastagonospora nodorum SN15]|uniref:Uncharacterized protein n=1 Tax=Phaeosphaeria nodorum (strain SN15 / ATCC MYA-4574 / FGSC 10173) TaxID=321614 RepID=Q0TY02_PHANO|nr:hypothetical protein SNOG_15628 [Parastagonospora nodorum SN15]EAT77003.2 hypothetical protein SNOG_15628 [Parastagonospora nodorum SN15]